MDKEELRDKHKRSRLKMSRAEVESKSKAINRKIIKFVRLHKPSSILTYNPIKELNEVELTDFINQAEEIFPGTRIDTLGTSINQPMPAEKYDLILVPTLAYDTDNNRLGWGGGFYDKLLATQPQAIKIGLCYKNGLAKGGLPRERHDQPLDHVMTET